jgi:cell division protein FtsB
MSTDTTHLRSLLASIMVDWPRVTLRSSRMLGEIAALVPPPVLLAIVDELDVLRRDAAVVREGHWDEVVAERDALIVRRDELLATIVKLSRDIPYAEEVKSANALIAEVGTLRSEVAELKQERDAFAEQAADLNAGCVAYEKALKEIQHLALDSMRDVSAAWRATLAAIAERALEGGKS